MKRGAIVLIVIAAVLIAVPLVIRNEFYSTSQARS